MAPGRLSTSISLRFNRGLECRSRAFAGCFSLLTSQLQYINLSVSVDINGLIESGRGTGPKTPRQPVVPTRRNDGRGQFQLETWVRGDENSQLGSPARPVRSGRVMSS